MIGFGGQKEQPLERLVRNNIMRFNEVCCKLAAKELKKTGTMVECMRDDIGIIKGKNYRVVGLIAGVCLRLEKEVYSHTATHFRKALGE